MLIQKKPFTYSLYLHGGILLALAVGALTFPVPVFHQQPVNIVQATTTRLPEPVHHQKVVHHVKPHRHHVETIRHHRAIKHHVVRHVHVKKIEHHKIITHHTKPTRAQVIAAKKHLAEQKRLKAQHAKAIKNTITRYQAMILQSISQHWLIPAGVNKKLQCKLNIELAADGTVKQVSLLQSSGDPSLDRSAIAAVYKSSPLPLPAQKSLYKDFKNLTLLVTPKDVIA